ncbi:MAG: SPFH domain-containing protein [Minisyncoccia bacterium]|jgi:regulator of protease activity HflC (stomatin/prohibitin superfamily)
MVMGLVYITFLVVAYALAQYQICFTFVKEGTAVAIMRGRSFDHFIMAWRKHYLNDPRRRWYDSQRPTWEVLPIDINDPRYDLQRPTRQRKGVDIDTHSAYMCLSFWRLLEPFGIYWYGLSPFYSVGEYWFEWAESRIDTGSGDEVFWARKEPTRIVYVASFPYWIRLTEARDHDNIPVDIDYLLTVRVTNPYKARFIISNWLTRITADADNVSKVWIGNHEFEEIVRERTGVEGKAVIDQFVDDHKALNINLPTEHAKVGAPERYGITVDASSLVDVTVSGTNAEALVQATTARIVAERKAQANVEAALGDAKAIVIRADANKAAIETVYRKVAEFGQMGILLQQLEAMQRTNAAGATVIWANNPFMASSGIAEVLQRANISLDDLVNFIHSRQPAQA